MMVTDSTAVLVLWWIAIGLTVLVIVPLAIYLLHKTWRAANLIRRYSAETLEAGVGIASHTANIPALDATVEGAGPIVARAGRLESAAAQLESILVGRVS